MGKILVIFLCIFSVVVFGSSSENLKSNSQIEIPTGEFLTKMRELENFHEEFKTFKSSLVELSAAFGRFHQSLTKNGTGESGQTGQAEEVSSTTPSPRQQSSTPASKSISSCSDAMATLPTPRSKKQTINPHGNSTSLEVLCDFETDGGGWTIIQKRSSGPKEQFKQNWNEYANGFGSLDGNFWLGLENIRALTQNGDQELRIQLEDFEGNKKYAKYSSFSILDASDFYRLTLDGFSGDSTLQDSFAPYHNGQKFSTIENDNDNNPFTNCAVRDGGGGGWWFSDFCGRSNLNGLYFEKGEDFPLAQGIYWYHWKGYDYSLAKSEMKIRTKKP